ncbi:MAG: ATP-binding cassette domain-containing protein [Proteobacteria bacterium]|nr:ATP-binding cassette domain-containing protein [Pseudomonadota bacterium]
MEPIVEVKNLKKHFKIKSQGVRSESAVLKAVDDVSFEVYPSETLGIVGESGCGKSTLGKVILRLYEKTAGDVYFKGDSIFEKSKQEMRAARKSMQMIFQDPFSSLNPRKKVGDIIAQPMKLHGFGDKKEIENRTESLLSEVGLDSKYKNRYPHQFSGGQRQRIGIARAIAMNPDLVICDESVSALDVSIQAQVLNLLKDLQDKYNLTYIFIAHDLSVVEFMSDRIIVMYLGKILEIADKEELMANPAHPYTQSLFAASPGIDPRKRQQMKAIKGDVPSPINPPGGCYFHPRCEKCMDICEHQSPSEVALTEGHRVSCFLYNS